MTRASLDGSPSACERWDMHDGRRIRVLRSSIAAKERALTNATDTARSWRELKAQPPGDYILAELHHARRQTLCDRNVAKCEARAETLRAELAALRAELATLDDGRCGARCRDGHTCKAPRVMLASGKRARRCKLHGGRSTGPKTAEGRERARAALARGRLLRGLAREFCGVIDLDGP